MKLAKAAIAAFCICVALSLIIGTLLLLQVRAIPKYTRMVDTGKKIAESVLEMELQGQAYLLYRREDVVDNTRDTIDELRKLQSSYEKAGIAGEGIESVELAAWEEATNLYERLFDQFVLYRKAVEKNIAEIRELEKSILAVIYSKMNPERGVIGLQEVRIHEKGYLLYRNHPEQPDERSFQDKRKEAVANFLVWAHDDKRIEELMGKDDELFNEILSNYQSQDNTMLSLKRESRRIQNIGERLFEEGNNGLKIIQRRCAFLSVTLLVMWMIVGIAIVSTRLR
jgi:transcription initiation factor TFIIIB Brf1 subunit/transcription initiation factor TFIIB